MDKSVERVTVWHHEALSSDANSDPRDRLVHPYLTLTIDSFSCTFLCQRLNKLQFNIENLP